ncbi:MAG: aminopeptidase [Bacteroidota bacterium]
MSNRRKILLALLLFLCLLAFIFRDLLSYGIGQARGEAHMLLNTRPITECLSDPAFPDSLKTGLRMVGEIKSFARQNLGILGDSEAVYTTFFDLKGRPLMHTLRACAPYSMQPYTWSFPVVGRFPYKGFFNNKALLAEQAELRAQGLETETGEVAAFSTLGWLPEPVLSSMLQRGPGSLANLIIHELTHGWVFVPDSTDFNENLANFIADEGARLFIAHKYGPASEKMHRYKYIRTDRERYMAHLHRGYTQLDSTYNSAAFKILPDFQKAKFKAALMKSIFSRLDTLQFSYPERFCGMPDSVNNNYFLGYSTYEFRQSMFKKEFEERFKGNLPAYIVYLRNKYGGPKGS